MARSLLVEDEVDIRTILEEALADAGHKVAEAANGDSVALLLDGHVDFDLLVTDINMPGLLDGSGLAACFRKCHSVRPILYITRRADALLHVAMQPNREAALFKPHDLWWHVATLKTMFAAAAPKANRRPYPDPAASTHGSQTVLTAS